MPKSEDELRKKAEQFIEALAEAGIKGAIVPDSFRDYLVKLAIHRSGKLFGQVNLYHSSTKDQFTLRTHELKDKAILPDLEACWDRLSCTEHKVAVRTAPSTGYQAYVDGSYLGDVIGYGVVVLKDDKPVAELHGPVQDEALQGMRQVGGELQAVYQAIEWCQANGIGNATICYDYEGIEKWATGAWKTNTPATQAYAAYMRGLPLALCWQKVEGHSGDRWNDRADQLARQGAGRSKPRLSGPADLFAELEDKVCVFIQVLAQEGIPASYQGLVNNQFARIDVLPSAGLVDVYNTHKRPMSKPYLHGFTDRALQERIENLWRAFLTGQGQPSEPSQHLLGEASYYYEILNAYRDCALDFVDLARALDRAYRQANGPDLEVESSRYDFESLEALYFDLKGGDKVS